MKQANHSLKVSRKKKPVGAKAMLGFAARFCGEKGRRTTRVVAELGEGER
jgi:hypothetical protein